MQVGSIVTALTSVSDSANITQGTNYVVTNISYQQAASSTISLLSVMDDELSTVTLPSTYFSDTGMLTQ